MPYLFRPAPSPEESLSSWRQRAARENGFRLYPLHAELRRTDPDVCGPETAEWLVQNFGLTHREIDSLTLASLHLNPVSGATRHRSRWLVPLRYSNRGARHGSAFCPCCLAADAKPYFRLKWRLAMVTACSIHDLRLLDQCPACGKPVWPQTATVAPLHAQRFHALHSCHYCTFDLRDSVAPREDASLSGRLEDMATNGTQIALGELQLSAGDYFEGLAVVCQAMLRDARQHEHAPTNKSMPQWRPVKGAGTAKQFEELCAADRHTLVSHAVQALSDWPHSFIEFANGRQVKHYQLQDAQVKPPDWMRPALEVHLRRQKRGTTRTAVQGAVAELRAAGKAVTKVSVRAVLQAGYATAIDQELARRSQATLDELDHVFRELECMAGRLRRRRSSELASLRNSALAALAILLQRPIGELVLDSIPSLRSELGRLVPRSETAGRIASRVAQWLVEWEHGASGLWGSERAAAFSAVRSGRGCVRPADRALRQAMRHVDDRLRRDFRVFRQHTLGNTAHFGGQGNNAPEGA